VKSDQGLALITVFLVILHCANMKNTVRVPSVASQRVCWLQLHITAKQNYESFILCHFVLYIYGPHNNTVARLCASLH